MIQTRFIWIVVIYLTVINVVIWLSNNVDVRTGERIGKSMGMKKQKRKIKNVELCMACGARTNYSKDEPTSHRYGYVEGSGQFCFKCSYFGIEEQHQQMVS